MSRDPQRIDKVLSKIREIWHQYPDLRLGQLLTNATYEALDPEALDIFYIEDEELMVLLGKWAKNFRKYL